MTSGPSRGLMQTISSAFNIPPTVTDPTTNAEAAARYYISSCPAALRLPPTPGDSPTRRGSRCATVFTIYWNHDTGGDFITAHLGGPAEFDSGVDRYLPRRAYGDTVASIDEILMDRPLVYNYESPLYDDCADDESEDWLWADASTTFMSEGQHATISESGLLLR